MVKRVRKKSKYEKRIFFVFNGMACIYESPVYKKTSSFNEIGKKTIYL